MQWNKRRVHGDSLLENAGADSSRSTHEIESQVKAREDKLAPLYTQIACEFADLHDRTGRMEAKGVIRKGLEWRRAREYFYWRVRRRLIEQELVGRVQMADGTKSNEQAKAIVDSWQLCGDDDQAAVAALQGAPVDEKIEAVRIDALKKQLKELYDQLPE